jgi:serine/threonine protein phosphatase PrpC
MSGRVATFADGGPPDDPRLWICRPRDGFFAIACPLGVGTEAATFALERIGAVQTNNTAPAGNVEHPRVAALRRSIIGADAAWRAISRADAALDGSGATLAILSLVDAQAVVAHLGDCRVYQLRDGHVIRETADHVQEATARPSGVAVRAIVRAFGMGANPEVNAWDVELGDVLALSAGVHHFVSVAEMVSMLRRHLHFAAAAAELIRLARDRGALDYCGIVLVRVPDREGTA